MRKYPIRVAGVNPPDPETPPRSASTLPRAGRKPRGDGGHRRRLPDATRGRHQTEYVSGL